MIKLENVSKYYYSANLVVPALKKIKLELNIGEFVAITGESGSGKSTLLNIISGLDTYDDGELYINDEATSHFDDDDWEEYRKNKIGFVFQNYNLIENFSALYNVESSLLIQGYESKQARKTAKELLIKVGLKKQINERTSKLSSGQKQRLSIARALAKDTDIIVADEPTGNLDSETGKQIMKLFGELAKDKLIIVVTHNYEETASYVTRKIRLHDGEIVSDTQENKDGSKNTVNHDSQLQGTYVQEDTVTAENKDKLIYNNKSDRVNHRKRKSDPRIAWRFAIMNITTQPRRVALFMWFLLLTAAVSFIFLGEIYSNMDDTFTKDYNDMAFLNSDNTRIIVKKPDQSEITAKDIECFNKIKNVEMSDRYDYSNDINYYITFKKDYDYLYQPKENSSGNSRLKIVSFLQSNKFMKSSTCITKDDLSIGRLPAARNEVVLYSKDKSMLGQEQICYFTCKNMWGYDNYYSTNVKIVGLLKKESSQVYFSCELCNMLSLNMYEDSYMMYLSENIFTGDYNVKTTFIPVIGEGLKKGELKVSADLAQNAVYTIPGPSKIFVYRGGYKEGSKETLKYDTQVLNQYNEYSIKFVEINEDWFYELYHSKSNQASLYIKDYIYTDQVLNKLTKLGYKAISSYRISSVKYNPWKVDQRNTAVEKALIVLIIIALLEVLIIESLLKIKQNNYIILSSMGMSHKTIKLINYFEMFLYTAASIIITSVLANVMNLFELKYLANRIKYYNFITSLIFILFNLLTIAVTVWSFNRYLKRKQKWS